MVYNINRKEVKMKKKSKKEKTLDIMLKITAIIYYLTKIVKEFF